MLPSFIYPPSFYLPQTLLVLRAQADGGGAVQFVWAHIGACLVWVFGFIKKKKKKKKGSNPVIFTYWT